MMKIYRDPIDFFMFSSVAFLVSLGFEAPQVGLVGSLNSLGNIVKISNGS
jgi:hypothetical protein